MSAPEISIVIPAKDEAQCLPYLIDEIRDNIFEFRFEVIIVDDGSKDGTEKILSHMKTDGRPWLRVLHHNRSYGQSAALRSGLIASKGEVIVMMDADGQNDPKYIPELVRMLAASEHNVGMVQGQRIRRKSSSLKKMASRIANSIRGALLKDNALDSACGLKAIRKRLFLRLPFFNAWHRFLPALIVREGHEVKYIQIIDRPRLGGQSKYGIWDRGSRGILDLFGVWWLMKRGTKNKGFTEVN